MPHNVWNRSFSVYCVLMSSCFCTLSRERMKMGKLKLLITDRLDISSFQQCLWNCIILAIFFFFFPRAQTIRECYFPNTILYTQLFQSWTQLCHAFDMLFIFQWNENNSVLKKLGNWLQCMQSHASLGRDGYFGATQVSGNKWKQEVAPFCSNKSLHSCSFAH